MKHGNRYYAEVSRAVWDYGLSDNAILLFFWLNELEQKYTGRSEDFFYRTNSQLCNDLGWCERKLKKAKSELLRHTDLVQSWQAHFVDRTTGKKSEKHFTAYRILR